MKRSDEKLFPFPAGKGPGDGFRKVRGRVMRARNIVVGQRVQRVKLERAKELRRSMTPAETALWERLKGNRLARIHFRRQQVIHGFIVDFYCHAAGLVVELDGEVHELRKISDAERDVVLESLGLRVVRFENQEVLANLDGVLARITELCKET
jgi:very-short-patch-repair endonuclease